MSQTLIFRLKDGNFYEFKYSKYSEFIDNLEPEPGDIIDVLEPFTLKKFETAQIEYNKYVAFKGALEDIIKNTKLWSEEELKEFSKYDLENPVLEWLMIRDNREDRETKDILNLYFLKKGQIGTDRDNIILYYIIYKTKQEKFFLACRNGHLKVAQWLYSLGGIEFNFCGHDVFGWACGKGHLEVAQWLYSIGDVDIHIQNDAAFRWACEEGHLDVAQWLYSLGDVNIHINDEYAFRWACRNGHLEVAQWLYSIGSNVYHQVNNPYDDKNAFKMACKYGQLKVAQWLWSLGGFNKYVYTYHKIIEDWLATLE